MCLYSWKTKKKAENDIECYKVLKYDSNGILSSLFQDSFKWEIGNEYKAERAKYIYKRNIDSGYFHSYISEMTALDVYNSLIKDYNSGLGTFSELKILKCIIPKGTYFYEGIHSDGRDGYASKSLKIVEML